MINNKNISIVIWLICLATTCSCTSSSRTTISPYRDSTASYEDSSDYESIDYEEYSNTYRPEPQVEEYNTSETEYSYSSYERVCSQEERIKCLALAWGPDVCSLAFEEFAENKLDAEAYDTVTSPLCGKMISETLDVGFSEGDLALGLTTGLLDDIGSKSWEKGGFWGVMGAIASKGSSFILKMSAYEACIQKCSE